MRRDSLGPGACFYFHTISSLQPDCNTIAIPLQTNKSDTDIIQIHSLFALLNLRFQTTIPA